MKKLTEKADTFKYGHSDNDIEFNTHSKFW